MNARSSVKIPQRHGAAVWLGLGLGCVFTVSNCVRLDIEGHCLSQGGDAWCVNEGTGTVCIAEYKDGDRVVSPNGDGCFDETPPCVDSNGCIHAKYGLSRAVNKAEAEGENDLIEEQLSEAGCPKDISMDCPETISMIEDVDSVDELMADIARLRADLESGGCASVISATLNKKDSEILNGLTQCVDEIIEQCTAIGPPCEETTDCDQSPETPVCIEGNCRPCDHTTEDGNRVDCKSGFVCNEMTGRCDEACSLPDVSYNGICVTCDEIPEPDTAEADDPADAACDDAAVAANVDTKVCDRDNGRCAECTEEKTQECANDEFCDPSSGQCVPQCEDDDDCASVQGRPYCSDDMICEPCGAAPTREHQHALCSSIDSTMPACCGDACCECTPDNTAACDALGFQCDPESNTCVCTAHEQCGDAACNFFTGVCLPGESKSIVHVGGPAEDFTSLTDAVEYFGPMAEGTIIVHQGDYNNQAVIVNDGRALAFLAAEIGEGIAPPRWILSGRGSPQLTVSDATVLLDGIQVSGNASTRHPGLLVNGGRAWVDRSRIINNFGGGILAQNAAELVLHNSFVGQSVSSVDALWVDSATATVLYSTLIGAFNATALRCTAAIGVDVRNSILVTEGGTPPDEIDCATGTITFSATEGIINGTRDVGLFPVGMADSWFVNYGAGDYRLQNDGLMDFADVAQWQTGDPSTDIQGQDRQTTNGDPDYAGADSP